MSRTDQGDKLMVGKKVICGMGDIEITRWVDYHDKIGLCSIYKHDFNDIAGISLGNLTYKRTGAWQEALIDGISVGDVHEGRLYFAGGKCRVFTAKNGQTMPLSSYRHGKASD